MTLKVFAIGGALGLAAGLGFHWMLHHPGQTISEARASETPRIESSAVPARQVRVVYPASGATAQLAEASTEATPAPVPAPVVPTDTKPTATASTDTEPSPYFVEAKLEPGNQSAKAAPGDAEVQVAPPNGVVNINTASIEALDHLAGAGRIGRSIARHRPYQSLDDLVRKRVLRRDVYERIRGQIATN